MLKIYLFGNLRAMDGHAPMAPPARRHTERLWAYLLLNRNRVARRSEVAEVLFPRSHRARAALRQHLHDLLSHLPDAPLGRRWLVTDAETIQWNPNAACWLDVSAFEDACDATDEVALATDLTEGRTPLPDGAALEAAAALYTDELLTDIGDGWVVEHRERLSLRLSGLLEHLCAAQSADGRTVDALTTARAWVSRDPLDERSNAALARLLAESGNRPAALQQLDAYRDTLATEIGIEPSDTMLALAAAIRTGSLLAPTRPTEPPRQTEPEAQTGHAGDLPDFETEMVGAWRVEQASELLAETQLLTITGPPGCGKSRVAAETARRHVERTAGGACRLDLSGLESAGELVEAVAALTGHRPGALDSVPAAVAALARRSQADAWLLVLDNVDGVVGPCAALTEGLLQMREGVRVVAASRERLGIDGETVWRLPLLEVRAADRALVARELPESVELYVRRLNEGPLGGALTDGQREAIARLCARLDGLPLAIEHAAAALGIEAGAAPDDDAHLIALLDGTGTVEDSRHRSLTAAVAPSIRRLTGDESRLLKHLSGLLPTFGVEDVLDAPVAEGEVGDDPPDADALEMLERLVRLSLVDVDAAAPPDGRFRVLNVVGQVMRSLLAAEG